MQITKILRRCQAAIWEHKLNFHGILPRSVTFSFEETDIQAEQETAKLQKMQADTFATYAKDGILPLEIVHQMMQDAGVLKPEYMTLLNEQDITPNITTTDEMPVAPQSELDNIEQTHGVKIIFACEWV